MVCFSTHRYVFEAKDRAHNFELHAYFHADNPCQMAVVNADMSSKVFLNDRTNKEWQPFRVTSAKQLEDVYQQQKDHGDHIVLFYDRIWNQGATNQAMCVYSTSDWQTLRDRFVPKLVDDEQAIAAAIHDLVLSRLQHDENEIFLTTEFKDAVSLPQLRRAVIIAACDERTKITRAATLPDGIFLLCDDRHAIWVNAKGVRDGNMPVLDLDDGFDKGPFGCSTRSFVELNDAFIDWKRSGKPVRPFLEFRC